MIFIYNSFAECPLSVRQLFESSTVHKYGFGIASDLHILMRSMLLCPCRCYDLAVFVKEFDSEMWGDRVNCAAISLVEFVYVYLGRALRKPDFGGLFAGTLRWATDHEYSTFISS